VTSEYCHGRDNKLSMAKRQCLGCGGELVMVFRPSGNDGPGKDLASLARMNTNWRCGTCGQEFTAAALRADKREEAKVVKQG